jgi:3-phenylpropionate/trans-cinnamate dioxygenase ferredoxin reductase subunit
VEQAKSVAASISGEKKPYHQVPWFWSDQYNLKLQIAGFPTTTIILSQGSMEEEKFSVFISKRKNHAVDTINNLKNSSTAKS